MILCFLKRKRVHPLAPNPSHKSRYINSSPVSCSIFFMILRILKHMHFQPRMGVLTRTLVEAGPDIMNFFILWTIVFLGYSFMGHLVFGRSVDFVSARPLLSPPSGILGPKLSSVGAGDDMRDRKSHNFSCHIVFTTMIGRATFLSFFHMRF